MKKVKLICIIGGIVGTLLLVAPCALAVVSILGGNIPVNIVGGADGPTFKLILERHIWLSWIGISMILSCVIFFIRHRRYIKNR